jgi:hypothetical protein
MMTERWFLKDKGATATALRGAPATPGKGFAAKLRPHELIALLTHHYNRVRARNLPRVRTTISVVTPAGRPAVVISFGKG